MAGQDRRRAVEHGRTRRGDVVAVGLTGGIGAGKSTALAMFAELGAITVSADRVVHALYQSPEVVALVVEHFGEGVLGADGGLDRRSLAALVHDRPDELRWLEDLTHPLVHEEVERIIETAPAGAVVVCEIPLLFESEYEGMFDLLVTVEAGRENRFSRSAYRFDPHVFAEFESLQATSERRIAGSDVVYWNDGSVEHLRAFVRQAFGRAQSLSDGSAAPGPVGGPSS